MLMNIYRNIDRSKIQFDFISHRKEKCDYDDEIASLGGRVYRISSLGQSGPVSYIRALKNIMSTERYVAVHSHTDYQCGFPAFAAKMSGIQRRICHSHANQWFRRGNFQERMALKALQTLIKFAATDYGACSEEAARFLFGEKKVENGKVQILKNGIEVSEYLDTAAIDRSFLTDECRIPPIAKVIGHVGNFSAIKNQSFILKVLRQLLTEGMDVFAVLVGDGPLRSSIAEEASKLGIRDHVRFPGVRADIPSLMQAFDVLLFPSLHEGFGIVTLEAQCAGIPCVVSDTVPKSTDMGLGLVSYLSLSQDLLNWSEAVKKAFITERPDRQTITKKFSKLGFNIRDNVPHWLELYGVS